MCLIDINVHSFSLDLNFSNLPELVVFYKKESRIEPKKRLKITLYFRPKEVKEYEFELQFWVNSLCEEIVRIKGEGKCTHILIPTTSVSEKNLVTRRHVFSHSHIYRVPFCKASVLMLSRSLFFYCIRKRGETHTFWFFYEKSISITYTVYTCT